MAKMKKAPFGSLQIDVQPFIDAESFAPATAEERAKTTKVRESVSYWADAWRRLKENTIAMIALVIIIALFLFAFVGPLIVDYTYSEQLHESLNLGPMEYSVEEQTRISDGEKVFPHVFGTDRLGRDIFVRVMQGTRISMTVGVLAALLVLLIGATYGAISGFFGGRVDTIMMRIVEVIYAIPEVLVVLLLAITIEPSLSGFAANNINNAAGKLVIALGPSIISIFVAFALLYWVSMARIIRGQVLQLKEQEFVLAAKALGASNGRIIRKHLLPNSVGAMVSATTLQIPSAIFLESFLSFLGMGVQPPMTSLGSLASDALESGVGAYPSRLIFPAAILSIMILAFNLFGDGLRDALDPRMK